MKDKGTGWPTRAELLVLQLLQGEAGGKYGLEIVDESNGLVKRGSVYVLLDRLRVKGFVKATQPKSAADHAGLPRPIYQLTADGMRVLAAAEELGLAYEV